MILLILFWIACGMVNIGGVMEKSTTTKMNDNDFLATVIAAVLVAFLLGPLWLFVSLGVLLRRIIDRL